MDTDDNVTLGAPAAFADRFAEAQTAWRAKAHQIINEHMDRAKSAADSSPAIRLLIPSIRTALHDLFDHMVSSPLEYADHQRAIAETEVQTTAPVVSDLVVQAAPSSET